MIARSMAGGDLTDHMIDWDKIDEQKSNGDEAFLKSIGVIVPPKKSVED